MTLLSRLHTMRLVKTMFLVDALTILLYADEHILRLLDDIHIRLQSRQYLSDDQSLMEIQRNHQSRPHAQNDTTYQHQLRHCLSWHSDMFLYIFL